MSSSYLRTKELGKVRKILLQMKVHYRILNKMLMSIRKPMIIGCLINMIKLSKVSLSIKKMKQHMREDGYRIFEKMITDMSNKIFYRRTQDKEEVTTTKQHNSTTNDRNLKVPINEKCSR
jgi:hypothetical protein